MGLLGAWLRQLLTAGTAAALVPGAMFAALAVVLVGAGGFGGLGALRQLVSGPQVSPAERAAATGAPRDRDVAPVAPAVAGESARPAAPAPSARRPRPRPGPQAPPPVTVTPPAPVPPRAPPPVAGAPPAAVPRPPPAPARDPTLNERTKPLTDGLKDTVGEVGTALKQIIDGLGRALGRILDPPPPAAPGAGWVLRRY